MAGLMNVAKVIRPHPHRVTEKVSKNNSGRNSIGPFIHPRLNICFYIYFSKSKKKRKKCEPVSGSGTRGLPPSQQEDPVPPPPPPELDDGVRGDATWRRKPALPFPPFIKLCSEMNQMNFIHFLKLNR